VSQLTKQAFNSFASAKMTKIKFWASKINHLRGKLFFNRPTPLRCTKSDQGFSSGNAGKVALRQEDNCGVAQPWPRQQDKDWSRSSAWR
jgi:hypothetical protein